MPRKKKSSANQGKATLVFPTHAEIEETLKRRIKFCEHPDRKGPYPLPILDFLINAIGCEIETGEGDEEFAKDAEFYNPHWYTKGITNGELFYSLYRTISRMAEDEKFEFFELPLCDQEALYSMLDLATTLFLDRREEPELAGDSIDFWTLYAWTRRMRGFDLWLTDNGEPAEPPPLGDLRSDDWEAIAEDVKEHFSEDGDDEYIEIALLEQQPHWPTFQEFRSAKAHLLNWYGRTRVNTKARAD